MSGKPGRPKGSPNKKTTQVMANATASEQYASNVPTTPAPITTITTTITAPQSATENSAAEKDAADSQDDVDNSNDQNYQAWFAKIETILKSYNIELAEMLKTRSDMSVLSTNLVYWVTVLMIINVIFFFTLGCGIGYTFAKLY